MGGGSGGGCSKGPTKTESAIEPVQRKPTKKMGKNSGPSTELLDGYGDAMFRGKTAKAYLDAVGGVSLAELESGAWVKDGAKADAVAKALLLWATDRGATSWCHWFQPLAATYRCGQAGCVQLAFFKFNSANEPVWNLDGSDLLQGETDGSSYPNGGLRATHTAGGYLTIDPESPIWLRGDCVFVPAVFVSYNGHSLDEKLPLKRAVAAMSKEGARLFGKIGVETSGMVNNIGLEQEFFLLPRDQYVRRPDLQLVGRTIIGRLPARGQEGCDHYMSPPHFEGAALAALKDIQSECFKLGIPLQTRHREVAPNQYETAPRFGAVCVQTDQNLQVMQVMDDVARKHGLAAILVEKPFAGINGSGKHNNWSISTKEGAQLYNPIDLCKKTGKKELFPIVMAATVSAIDKFGDLMRMAIASPGNDFRLGAMEAPPAVMSTYLGQQMTDYLQSFMDSEEGAEIEEYKPQTTTIDLGVDDLPPITAPAEDRNRTSPFPYGGYRFEFRAVGSSQNVSLVNTVLNSMMADAFKCISDRVDAGENAIAVAKELLKTHFKCIYNGNGYDPEWPDRADKIGVTRIDSGVEAIKQLTAEKNVALFTSLGIFTAEEVAARQSILLELYTGVVEMEAQLFIDMAKQLILPAAKQASLDTSAYEKGVKLVETGLAAMHAAGDDVKSAEIARELRLSTMVEARAACDALEAKCPASLWPIATYKELLFMDMDM